LTLTEDYRRRESARRPQRLTPAYLTAVATFYDMFELHPKPRHDVYMCTNISCSLRGADELYETMLGGCRLSCERRLLCHPRGNQNLSSWPSRRTAGEAVDDLPRVDAELDLVVAWLLPSTAPAARARPCSPAISTFLYDFDSLAKAGTMLGSGAITVVDDSHGVLEVALKVATFYEHESCGKCVPCREGTRWTLRMFQRIASGAEFRGELEAEIEAARERIGVH
jgi:hypothetical protein